MDEVKLWWRYLGQALGYPKCCIDEFCNTYSPNHAQCVVSESKGFIPCMKHTKLIMNGEIKLVEIPDAATRKLNGLSIFPFFTKEDSIRLQEMYMSNKIIIIA